MKKWMLLIGGLFLTIAVMSAEIIDERRVYNPELNECVSVFNVKTQQNNQTGCMLDRSAMYEVEQIFLSWILADNSPMYLREFDTSRFYYQFVENNALGKCKTAVMLIIPDTDVRENFYSELAAGLDVPGVRCLNAHCTWINDGEIFSFVVDREEKSVSEFRNWRFKQEDFYKDPARAYYSQLIINYKCNPDIFPKTTLVHYVNNKFRAEIPVEENYPILLPKDKISTLVFYCDGRLKGVLCFDMSAISKTCPMNFESTVYLKDRLGYERILYAKPKCEGIYELSIIEKAAFEEITSLNWETIEEFRDDVAQN